MLSTRFVLMLAFAGAVPLVHAQEAPADPVATLVGRLDLERYKATIKELTRFGDRRQGTERNRKALDWIEAQLKSYGCATERLRYDFVPPPPRPAGARPAGTAEAVEALPARAAAPCSARAARSASTTTRWPSPTNACAR
jgi:hypothetical protein